MTLSGTGNWGKEEGGGGGTLAAHTRATKVPAIGYGPLNVAACPPPLPLPVGGQRRNLAVRLQLEAAG